MVCGTHISVASCLTPPVGWVHAPFSKNFGVDFGFQYWVYIIL